MNGFGRIIVLSLFIVVFLTSCSHQNLKKAMSGEHYRPLNTIPMYGAPEREKTDSQKEADKNFIAAIEKSEGSRQEGAKRFAAAGWASRKNGDPLVAMKRFNQSWLLDPGYYQAYWGFGTLMLDKNDPEAAISFLDKALTLIGDEKEEARQFRSELLVEAARAYAWHGHALKQVKVDESKRLLNKAVLLIDEALRLDPQNKLAYFWGVQAYRSREDYVKAWDMVKKARSVADYEIPAELIDKLSKEMPDPG